MAAKPPALPPRSPPAVSASDCKSLDPDTDFAHSQPNTTLSPAGHGPSPYLGGLHDPRTSSTQSLRPAESPGDNRRTLLIIYIHGFLGDETSFQSFPAHVHGLLTHAVSATHVVYTKIYPQYRSRQNISIARDNFSNWLAPHESDQTDVILVGHSLGGILAAEVVLIPAHYPPGTQQLFQHRILGLIAVDTPFLGMHPGVVGTGIASLFRAAPQELEAALPSPGPFSDPPAESSDPTFNPNYPNDVKLPERKGKLQRAWYFWNKHAGDVAKAAGRYVSSHVEFGGCLADYPGLRKRYNCLRALEDVDEILKPRTTDGKLKMQVRFVNYYSASTGPIKERPPSPDQQSFALEPPTTELQHLSMGNSPAKGVSQNPASSPRLSLEEFRDGTVVVKDPDELEIDPGSGEESTPLTEVEPIAMGPATPEELSIYSSQSGELGLPRLPQLPDPPPKFDPSLNDDEATRALSRREYERQLKAYERAVKDRDKTIKEREKLAQKRIRERAKQQDKEDKIVREQLARQQKEQLKRASTLNPEAYDERLAEDARDDGHNQKKLKDRKFCALPSKDPRTGQRDPTWVRVYMEGIDEVTAHTSMFNAGPTYAILVGDLVERIERWIGDDATRRLMLAELT